MGSAALGMSEAEWGTGAQKRNRGQENPAGKERYRTMPERNRMSLNLEYREGVVEGQPGTAVPGGAKKGGCSSPETNPSHCP